MQQLADLLRAEGVSMGVGEIAARLRCSRRRLYEVAPTKQGLLHAVAREHFGTGLRAGFEAAQAQTEPAAVITAYLNAGVATAVKLSTAFLKDLESTEEGREIIDSYQLARAHGLKEIMEAGIQQGHYNAHHSQVATEVVLGAAMRLRRAEFLADSGLTFDEAMEEAYALILHGLLAEPAARREPRTERQSTPPRVAKRFTQEGDRGR